MRLVGLIGALGLLVVAAAAVAEDEPPRPSWRRSRANGANKAACMAYLTARAAEVFGSGAAGGGPAPADNVPADPDALAAAARAALGPALQGGTAGNAPDQR